MNLFFSISFKNRYFKTAVLAGMLMSLGLTSAEAGSKHKRDIQVIREIYVIKYPQNINSVPGAISLKPRPVVTTALKSCDSQRNVNASGSIIIKNISPVSSNAMSNYSKQNKFLVKKH
jgi:hypothetical protein